MSSRHYYARHSQSTSDYTESELAEMTVDPYEETPKYTKGIIWAVCGAIAIAMLVKLWKKVKRTRFGKRIAANRKVMRLTAAVRYVGTAPTPSIGRYMHFPTRGVVFLIAVFWTFVLVWTFVVTPYYRSRWNVGSPPLAMRTGMMALGIFPFILAFGAKWNLVTFITGYSHEKLQVFHQWFSHLFFILSLLHTFPFVMAGREKRPNKDGLNPMGLTQIGYSWHIGKVYYWTGTAMLIPLAWLCFASLTPLRRRWYEMFKLLHFISAILFSAFFYLHCNALLTSWNYLYATAGLYGISFLMRLFLTLFRNGARVPKAAIQILPEDAVRLTIPTPRHRWKAGQHVFLNFCKARLLESHPYTVCNTASPDKNARTMTIVLKTDIPGGIGQKLLNLAPNSTPVLVDGPYGCSPDLSSFENILLMSGGSGASFVVSLLEDLGEKYAQGKIQAKRIVLHWAVRGEETRTWFEPLINSAASKFPEGLFHVHLYVTNLDGDIPLEVDEKGKAVEYGQREKDSAESSLSDQWHVLQGRPDLPDIIESVFEFPGSVGVASCGPRSFTQDVRAAIALEQKDIALGYDVRDVALYTEEFEW